MNLIGKKAQSLLLIACLACLTLPAAAGAAGKKIEVDDGDFTPTSLKIKKKQKVTFLWTGYNTHTVVFDNGWISPANGHGATWSRIFKKKGTFKYYCAQHPNMYGSVKVR